jgi:hypothetical protein
MTRIIKEKAKALAVEDWQFLSKVFRVTEISFGLTSSGDSSGIMA